MPKIDVAYVSTDLLTSLINILAEQYYLKTTEMI
jgi:hypothetical protein